MHLIQTMKKGEVQFIHHNHAMISFPETIEFKELEISIDQIKFEKQSLPNLYLLDMFI